tara:strand:+ start:763 stop:1176 length:414 start_codon:yes stop_codon:yes gene_type:complete
MKVEIVSAEKEIYSGTAEMVFAPAAEGEIGVAPGHAPLLTLLGPGEVRVKVSTEEEASFYVSGGMIEVQPKLVTILSDTASRAEDLDEAAVQEARDAAQKMLEDGGGSMDYAKARAQLAETAAQIRAIQRLRRRAGR